jgi:hypothetical protein
MMLSSSGGHWVAILGDDDFFDLKEVDCIWKRRESIAKGDMIQANNCEVFLIFRNSFEREN